jgi:hypothetical protein
LLKCCRVPEKAIYSNLFHPLLPFLLGAFGLKLPLAFFLLKFSVPFNTTLILMDGPLAISDFSHQNNLDRNFCHLRFKLDAIAILPSP